MTKGVKRARALSRYALVSATALTAVWPALARAQAPASPTAAQTEPAQQLQEVVVTAQKREQRLQDVPITVTTFNAAAIQALGAQELGDLQAFTPGLSVDDSSVTQPTFKIRGVSTDDFGIGTEPSAAVFIDGVYSARSGGALIFFDDLDRVEVLKGPQGTLFGRNAAAGAISITTKKPVDKVEGDLETRFGAYGAEQVSGMFNVPLTDQLYLRVNGLYNKRDGWLRDAATGQDVERQGNWSGRVALRWAPSADTDVQLTWDHDDTHKDGPMAVGVGPYGLNGGDPLGPFANDVPSHENRKLDDVILNAQHNFGLVTLTSITAGKQFHTNNLESETGVVDPAHDFSTENVEYNRSFSQEFRLNHSGPRFHWVAGVSYFQEHAKQDNDANTLTDSIDTVIDGLLGSQGQPPLSFFNTFASFGLPVLGQPWHENFYDWGDNKSYAAYGDMTWSATDRLNLTVGLRYTDDERKFTWLNGPHIAPALSAIQAPGALCNAFLSLNPQAPLFSNTGAVDVNSCYDAVANYVLGLGPTGDIVFNEGALEGTAFSRKASFHDLSPRFVVDYKIMPDVMTFASVSHGYKAGGFNSVQINSYFAPESVWNYEGGVKSEWLHHRLRINTSVYYFKYDNRQEISLVANNSIIPEYQTLTGNSQAWGVDLDAQWKATSHLTLSETAGYIDSTWVKRVEFPLGAPSTGVDISGQPTGEPFLRLVTGAHYEREVGEIGQVFGDVSYSYTSATRMNDSVRLQDETLASLGLIDASKLGTLYGDRNLTDARLGWKSPDRRYTVFLWAQNLLDARTVQSLNTITALTLDTPYVRLNPPRFWGVQLGYRF